MDGEWGDNVEIQAMSEIYDRPIEIYAYSHSQTSRLVTHNVLIAPMDAS